ncbi:hypothetical protein JCM10207_008832 [Rhodosporidiobolus poonsookiae]
MRRELAGLHQQQQNWRDWRRQPEQLNDCGRTRGQRRQLAEAPLPTTPPARKPAPPATPVPAPSRKDPTPPSIRSTRPPSDTTSPTSKPAQAKGGKKQHANKPALPPRQYFLRSDASQKPLLQIDPLRPSKTSATTNSRCRASVHLFFLADVPCDRLFLRGATGVLPETLRVHKPLLSPLAFPLSAAFALSVSSTSPLCAVFVRCTATAASLGARQPASACTRGYADSRIFSVLFLHFLAWPTDTALSTSGYSSSPVDYSHLDGPTNPSPAPLEDVEVLHIAQIINPAWARQRVERKAVKGEGSRPCWFEAKRPEKRPRPKINLGNTRATKDRLLPQFHHLLRRFATLPTFATLDRLIDQTRDRPRKSTDPRHDSLNIQLSTLAVLSTSTAEVILAFSHASVNGDSHRSEINVSHRCGQRDCFNPEHLVLEDCNSNASRDVCAAGVVKICSHSPPCIINGELMRSMSVEAGRIESGGMGLTGGSGSDGSEVSSGRSEDEEDDDSDVFYDCDEDDEDEDATVAALLLSVT